ncbi:MULTISPECIES: single-stranded DNA-binding protein [unclassified Frankia]
MLETTITLVGNLVDDPDHRMAANGASICTFRLASTPRRFDRSESRWVDGTTLFLRVSCWRQLADNVAASLVRGDRALVYGRLRQRSFETGEGERRVTYEIDADAVGTELTWHAARSERLARRPGSAPAGAAAATGVPSDPSALVGSEHGALAGFPVAGADADAAGAASAATAMASMVAGPPAGAGRLQGAGVAPGGPRPSAVTVDDSPWQSFPSSSHDLS